MANEIRVRQNYLGGYIEDNPLLVGATTLTSASLAAMVAIGSTQHMPLTLDPDGLYGEPEVVYVTAHTATATTATILRAQESSTARQHQQDVPWVHGPTADDFPTGVKLTFSGVQTVPSVTEQSVAWNLEEFDSENFHDTVTNTDRITVAKSGLYLFGYCIGINATINTGRFLGSVRKNGTATTGTMITGSRTEIDVAMASSYPAVSCSFPVLATAGDYFICTLYQSSGGNVTLDPSTCDFWATRLSR